MADITSEIVMMKYASLCATELGERVMRLGLEDAGELPDLSKIRSRQDVTLPVFILHHVNRNLLPYLSHHAFGVDLEPKLSAAIDQLYTCASMLSGCIIPLDMAKEDAAGDFVDVYLVKEECIIRVDKLERVNFFEIKENSKYKKAMHNVIQVIECFRTMSALLREKERVLRMERYWKQTQEYQKSQETATKSANKDDDKNDTN